MILSDDVRTLGCPARPALTGISPSKMQWGANQRHKNRLTSSEPPRAAVQITQKTMRRRFKSGHATTETDIRGWSPSEGSCGGPHQSRIARFLSVLSLVSTAALGVQKATVSRDCVMAPAAYLPAVFGVLRASMMRTIKPRS
jgi:hypothetical protein